LQLESLVEAGRQIRTLTAQAATIFRDTSGLIELMSTIKDPGRHPSRIPSGPSTTSSTSGPSGSMVKITAALTPTSLFFCALKSRAVQLL
jgi:hypothetical protein